MPFPWKKNRVPRISQFVADLQSPKRGGSLVVQTGFPTSLIDLFVKNRGRFSKPHRSKKQPPPDIPYPPPPSPATPPHPEPPLLPSVFPSPQIERHYTAVSIPDRVADHSRRGANVVVLMVKVLAVVLLLAATVKRLTAAITVSAFVLLLLEYAGPRLASFSPVESFLRKVLKKEHVLGTELSSEGLLIDEIEVVEMEAEAEAEEAVTDVGICYEMRSLSGGDVALIEDCSSKVLESCPYDDVSQCKIRTSRSGRFRSKMVKKLLPKKFRASKKDKKETVNNPNEGESISEVSSAVEEDKLEIEGEDDSSNTKPDGVDCGIGTTCSYDERKVEKVGKLGSSMVLVMIALVGLLLGRFPALGLLMTWCCLMKIFGILRRSHYVPIKCSVSNS